MSALSIWPSWRLCRRKSVLHSLPPPPLHLGTSLLKLVPVESADGQEQESAEQDRPIGGPVTAGRKRRASSSGSETSERSLREEIQEGFRDPGRYLRSLTIRVERAGKRSPGRFRGLRPRAARPRGPSQKRACFLCGAADHWRAACPRSSPKGDGTDTGSDGPSPSQDS